MTFTYYWTTPEKDVLKRDNGDDTITWIPANPANTDYAHFLESGDTAVAYVAPPEPVPMTTEQKVNQLLGDYGLTRDEMRTALTADAEL